MLKRGDSVAGGGGFWARLSGPVVEPCVWPECECRRKRPTWMCSQQINRPTHSSDDEKTGDARMRSSFSLSLLELKSLQTLFYLSKHRLVRPPTPTRKGHRANSSRDVAPRSRARSFASFAPSTHAQLDSSQPCRPSHRPCSSATCVPVHSNGRPRPLTRSSPLQQSDEIAVATQHPFLAAAGRHELTRDKLSEWLTQDRCYALHGCECMRFVHPRTNRPHPIRSARRDALVTRRATPSALRAR